MFSYLFFSDISQIHVAYDSFSLLITPKSIKMARKQGNTSQCKNREILGFHFFAIPFYLFLVSAILDGKIGHKNKGTLVVLVIFEIGH